VASGSIVRVQVESPSDETVFRDSRVESEGKARRASLWILAPRKLLATADDKVTPAGIDWIKFAGAKIDQMPRLLCPTQTSAPRISTRRAEI